MTHEMDHQEIDRRSNENRQRLLDLAVDYHNLANRLHIIEDHFDAGGIIEQMMETQAKLALELEALRDLWSRSHGPNPIGHAEECSNGRNATADDPVRSKDRSNG